MTAAFAPSFFFQDIKLDFGGGDIAGFGAGSGLSLSQRLTLCLSDAADFMADREEGTLWICKPSYANKGAEIIVLETVNELEVHLLEHHQLRE